MRKYFILQEKRMLHVLPLLLCVTLLLFGCLGVIYHAMTAADSQKEEKFRIAMVGTADDRFLQMGVSALSQMDASRFSLDIVQMEEPEARQALERGEISAYAVVPEGFVDKAMHGYFLPLQLVTVNGAGGLVSIIKEEITGVIADILLAAQKGIYGTWDAVTDTEAEARRQSLVDGISIAYTELALNRSAMYQEKELGVSDGLDYTQYLLCGLTVLFLMLMLLPFGLLLIRRDQALQDLLISGGLGCGRQLLCQYLAYFLSAVLMTGVLMTAAGLAFTQVRPLLSWTGFGRLLAVVFAVTAMSFFLFRSTDNLVSGMLLMFFVTLTLCFAGGCMYPAHFFPAGLEKLAGVLPSGLAREQVASCLTGQTGTTGWLLLWGAGFLGCAYGGERLRRAAAEGVSL